MVDYFGFFKKTKIQLQHLRYYATRAYMKADNKKKIYESSHKISFLFSIIDAGVMQLVVLHVHLLDFIQLQTK
jgi:hypothetical protein